MEKEVAAHEPISVAEVSNFHDFDNYPFPD